MLVYNIQLRQKPATKIAGFFEYLLPNERPQR